MNNAGHAYSFLVSSAVYNVLIVWDQISRDPKSVCQVPGDIAVLFLLMLSTTNPEYGLTAPPPAAHAIQLTCLQTG